MMPVSAIYIFTTGYLIWPPTNPYWIPIASTIGDKPTLLIIFSISGLAGALYSTYTKVHTMDFYAGGALAYVAGMTAIQTSYSPPTTNYLLTYAAILLCMYATFGIETLTEHHNERKNHPE